MPTKLISPIQPKNGVGSMEIIVKEDFDIVIDKLYPVQPATSTLGEREKMQYTLEDGRRIFIHRNAINICEEVESFEND